MILRAKGNLSPLVLSSFLLSSFLLANKVYSYFVKLLLRSGRTSEEALMILVPEAYKNHPTLTIKYPEVSFLYF